MMKSTSDAKTNIENKKELGWKLMMNTNDELRNFLVFSYFGEEYDAMQKSKDELMIKMCVKRAYLDFCRTLTYKKNQEIKKQKENFETAIYNLIKDHIIHRLNSSIKNLQNNFSFNEYYDYDKWHENVCTSIAKTANNNYANIFDSDKIFHYGQAQKWINMTMKYLVLLGYWNDTESHKLIEVLHVPVDSYTIESAIKDLKVPTYTDNTSSEDGSVNTQKPWSQWNQADYENFQKAIKNNVTALNKTPFEWEGPAWITTAKKQKNKKTKKNKKKEN